eukprot:TRINITY_DN12413_c0_g1_i2.p1 TRINITY_DN12413_c0_g1~~TRINITY_DN12413_c0_g1_i2.p1  ORF type:complete len:1451 (-),score=305.99 TRINITY_DN12413_c0_g1_i2:135-4487(-)
MTGVRVNLVPGSEVWVPCTDVKQASFVPGIIVQTRADNASVYVEDDAVPCDAGKTYKVPVSSLRPRFVRDEHATFADNTSLVYMNDAAILENLECRHLQDQIYTYTASVLLAVNPYKWNLNLYKEDHCEQYRGKHIGAMPPHPFAIAESAYRLLNREKKNQAILISGESGAGKTETAKIVMKYLAYVSGTGSDFANRMQARVSRAQPILESLGNAATLRNNNSSRFGKYNRVYFDDAGTLANAAITTYLLESSRVVVHAERERTYHVFYEMLTGLSDSKLKEFALVRGHPYKLLHTTGTPVSGFEETDSQNYERLVDALTTVGFDDAKINNCFQLLAGLVHLYDSSEDDENGLPKLAAEQDDEESPVVEINVDHVRNAARLLGFDADELAGMLRRKKIQIRGHSSLHEVARTQQQFRQVVHSLIKALYKRLFEHTVAVINASFGELLPPGMQDSVEDDRKYAGILDIYGFERLEKNSFEQLCINLANERLQQYFVENVLEAEQSLYKREALPWSDLEIPDATPVVNCVATVFSTLDDYSSRLARGLEKDATDERFCRQVTDEANVDHVRREILKKPQISSKGRRLSNVPLANEGFTLKHYAGLVDYNTRGWLDKNNDRLLVECEDLIAESTNPLVRSLADEDKLGSAQKSPFRSISKKYQQDLEALLSALSTCNLHYIRCFKPNEVKKPNVFVQNLVLDQIVQCGTIELVKIMHDGYPNRCPFVEITARFKGMLPESFQRYGDRTFIEALMLAYKVPPKDWALGMSRLFLKAGQLKKLEDMRSSGERPDPEDLERIVRSIIRKRWVRAGHSVCLVNYLPKMVGQINVRRASVALSQAALIANRLAPRLQAARERVAARRQAAKRRMGGAIRAVVYLSTEWRRIRADRLERVSNSLFLAATIIRRSRRWVTVGRQRAEEAKDIREAEKRRVEDERRRLEEQRRRLEEERKQDEIRRREEAEARKVEEALRREEQAREQKRREEEEVKRRAEEEQRRAAEDEERKRALQMDFEFQRQKIEEEKRKLEKERREFEQQKARDAERQRGMSMVGSASPHNVGKRSFTSGEALPQYADFEEKDGSTHLSDEEITPQDSVSHIPQQMHDREKEAQEREMARKLKLLEEDFRKKQEEVMRQMLELQQRNAQLERKLQTDNQKPQETVVNVADIPNPPGLTQADFGPSSAADGYPRPPRAATEVSIPVSRETQPPAGLQQSRRGAMSPGGSEVGHSAAVGRLSNSSRRVSTGSRNGPHPHRFSLVDPTFNAAGRRTSTGAREPRNSNAQQALRQSMGGMSRPIADPPTSVANADNVYAQRKWWSEQREFLMQDLYPFGSPVFQGNNQTPQTGNRSSVSGGSERPPLANAAPSQASAGGAGRTAGEAPMPKRTARRLDDQFAHVTDSDHDADRREPMQEPPPRQPRRSVAQAQSRGQAAAPTFFWGKRNSNGDGSGVHDR